MSDWLKNAEDAQANEFAPKRPKASIQPSAAVLPVLQNWQVLDLVDAAALESDGNAIDGEATVVKQQIEAVALAELPEEEGPEEEGPEARLPADTTSAEMFQRPSMAIADQLDPTILVTLETSQYQVLPGEEARYALTILNNGTETATYQILVEGWITEAWLGAPLPQFALARGARQQITVPIRAPRSPQTTAGDRALAFVVRRIDDAAALPPSLPPALTRRGAILTILPYTNLAIGEIEPKNTTLSIWQKQATLTIPVTNRSNYPVEVRLQVRQPASTYACTIELPQSKASQQGTQDAAQRKRATALIPPGQTIRARLKIRIRQQPVIALQTAPTALQLIASAVESETLPYQPWTRTVAVPVTTKPLLGLWQLTSLVGLLAMILVGMGVAGMVALLLVSMGMRQAEAVTPPASQVAVAPPPIIVAYIQAAVPQIGGQRAGQSAAIPVVAPSSSTPIVLQLPAAQGAPLRSEAAPAAQENAAIPILSVDQISAPGSLRSAPIDERTTAATEGYGAPATPAPMTYATMFHEIARRYDLNWRVLAAQAYVESGFDSVALGAQGDLGLMQIHPATWREWAPTVEVADPFDSYSNVLVAAAYFDYLRTTLSKRGHPEVEWTLVAYNWGIDKVLQHLESGQDWQALPALRQEYATEILRLAETIPSEE